MLAHEAIHDGLVERLAGAIEVLNVGQASDPEIDVPPVIEREAQERVERYIATARSEGTIAAQAAEVPSGGYFATPTLATDLPASLGRAARRRSSGRCSPSSACGRSRRRAIAWTPRRSGSPAGCSPAARGRSTTCPSARPSGNLYVNREITGAMVGRQPFGGNRLSGTGTKAGGPGYLLQFVEPRVVTENTVRHGLVV